MRLLSQTSATSPHYSGSSRHLSTLPHLSARSATSPLSHTSLRTFRYSHSPPNHPGRVSAAASPPRCEAGLGPRRKPPEEIGAVPPTSVRRRRSFPVRGVGR